MKLLPPILILFSIGNSLELSAQQTVPLTPQEANAKGFELGKQKKYAEALTWYRLSAQQSNPTGQYNLGLMYFNGFGVQNDNDEAIKWFGLSATQGDPDAQYMMGLMLYHGQGEAQNYAEAIKYFRLSANQSNVKAQYNLATMLYKGQGEEQNYEEAVKWFRMSASYFCAESQNGLGVMYCNGEGVSKDYVEAEKWYRLAAGQGLKVAQFNLGAMYRDGLGDYAEARRWFKLSADQGVADSQYNLGLMSYEGQGEKQNYKAALKWFRLSAKQSLAKGQHMLGSMYYRGEGVSRDYIEAIRWFKLAAEQGYSESQFTLGQIYLKGEGVPVDENEGIKWFQKAAEQGDEPAKNYLDQIGELKLLSQKVNLDSFLISTCECLDNVLKNTKSKIDFSIKTQDCLGALLRKYLQLDPQKFNLPEFQSLIDIGLEQKCVHGHDFYNKYSKYMSEKEKTKIRNSNSCQAIMNGKFYEAESFDNMEITIMDSAQLVTFVQTGYYSRSKLEWLDDCSYKLILLKSTNPFEAALLSKNKGDRIIRIIDIIGSKIIFEEEQDGVYTIGSMTKKN